jgi:hypothetical protein
MATALVAEGFAGLLYATGHTAALAALVLRDAAHFQEEDVVDDHLTPYRLHSTSGYQTPVETPPRLVTPTPSRHKLRCPIPRVEAHTPGFALNCHAVWMSRDE